MLNRINCSEYAPYHLIKVLIDITSLLYFIALLLYLYLYLTSLGYEHLVAVNTQV